jgi:succinate-semialdehyde dehydrogenase / glutarate-semialdehyde dehydrogenase
LGDLALTHDFPTELNLFIDGQWRTGSSGMKLPVVNPATGGVIAHLSSAGSGDLEEALAASAKGFLHWRALDHETRGAILHKTAALLRDRIDRIATLLTMEQGKPIGEARAEVTGSAAMFDFFAEEAKRAYGRVLMRPSDQRSIVIRQPVGPVVAFSPWNFPVYLMCKKLAAALAAGCSVIAKPPEETPASTGAVLDCLRDAGLPAGVAQAVFGNPDVVSRTLIASPVIRKVSFTGSVPVGKHLMRLCADGVKRMTMELGGHAPVLIFEDCDLERTLDLVVAQKFRNAGQVCVSPTRFYVHASLYDRFVDGFAGRARRVQVGNGLDPRTTMGPLANGRRSTAIASLIEDADAKGARVVTGGHAEADGYFFQPTLLADVPADAKIMADEPFGPVAVTRPFESFDEAVTLANSLPYGLAAYAFTENGRRANQLGDMLESGMVGINSFAVSSPDAPFGGVKESGFGSEGGPEALDGYLFSKAIHQA